MGSIDLSLWRVTVKVCLERKSRSAEQLEVYVQQIRQAK